MLCQFTVKNFKSIKDEITFDMQASTITEHADTIIETEDGEQFLPVSAIYGANAGGKSTVIEVLYALVNKVTLPLSVASNMGNVHIADPMYDIVPFLFSEETVNEPTEFEIFFRTAKAEYRYRLSVKREVIVYESLHRIKFETGRQSALYERTGDEIILKGDFSKLKAGKEISNTLPLISYLGITYGENEIVADVLSWFDKGINLLNYGNPFQELRAAMAKSEETRKLILDMIKEMDLDIVDLRIEKSDDDMTRFYTTHIVDGYRAELNFNDESSGTKKIIGLLPYIAESLVNGSTLVIDEMDAKLHPLLIKHVIGMFTDKEINKNHAQLIFTSHDLSTMNNEVFRRDEIWFVAKGNKQNTELYSLVEFKDEKGLSIRKDAKYDKQYLEGKYGAIPEIGN